MKINSIRIGYWNVNTLQNKKVDKLGDTALLKSIEGFDIIGLAETKHTTYSFNIHNYLCYPLSIKSINDTVSGGMLILINPNVRKGITFLNSTSEYQWLCLNKHFFNFKDDI